MASTAVASAKTPATNGTKMKNGTDPKNVAPAMQPQKTMEKLSKTTLLSATTWDVFSPPPINTFKGKLIPGVLNRYKNRRKMSIEVHRVTPLVDGNGKETKEAHSYEECVVRTLVPKNKEKRLEARKEGLAKLRMEKGSNEVYTSLADIVDDGDDDEDASVETAGVFGGTAGILVDTGGKKFDGWKARYRIPCRSITIKSQHKKSVFVMIEVEKTKQEREIIFDSLEDSRKFCEKLEQERQLEAGRSESRLQAALADIQLAPHETITLLIEIVSGWDLPIGDIVSSDPYVICMMGRKEVHRTKHISSTLDPIWTIKSGSLLVLTVKSKNLFIEKGLNFLIKDFDQFGSNETLGLVKVPAAKLYMGTGERMEFKLQPVPGKTEKEIPGYLAIRCRRATDFDKRFMEGYADSLNAVVAPQHPKTSNSTIRSIMTKQYKLDHGIKKYKIRPNPDPKRPDDTEWLTKDQIEKEFVKPSQHWTDAGTGNLGQIFLEVLGCDGLPNLDTGGFLGNKTDAFVSVVYEDVYVRTDTIDDTLSPRWLPWMKRAFILNIGHPSSQICLGVFDFDAGFDDHDLIGRVSVDITNLRKDTDYVLSYNIYPSTQVTGRKIKGKVNIRLRLEIPDERKMALAALEPPQPAYVNVKKRKEFRVIRGTCMGKYDFEQYSINTLKSYIDELREYQHLFFYLEDALMTLLLWRGHFPLKLGSKELSLPIHSFNAFVIAIVLVENPQYYPSFCFASIAWLLFAVMGWRRNSPDVWGNCLSYNEIMEKVVLGKTRTPPHDIRPFQGFEKAKEVLEVWMKRIADAEEKAQRDFVEAEQLEEERLREQEEIGAADADISTKVGGGISIDPVKSTIYPVQLLVGLICRALRFMKHVIYWEESYFSFWIATGSAILAIACLFVPWFFIMRWTARAVVWTLFGPWMKLVDVFYVSTLKPETEDERKVRELREKFERRLATNKAVSEARFVRENAAKMRDMKQFMFGKFAIRVPILKQDRYCDRPLAESSASPYEHKALTLAELAMQEAGYNRTRLPGQTLVGDMIPTVETQTFTSAPIGKATSKPSHLANSAPGGGKQTNDSTTAAYVKIGSIVTAAGVLTFFGVPILASCTESLVDMVHKLDSNSFGSNSDPGFVDSIRALFGSN